MRDDRGVTRSDDLAGARTELSTASGSVGLYSLRWLADRAGADPARLPMTVKILLEGLLRAAAEGRADPASAFAMARWAEGDQEAREIAFRPSRILMQDFTGVPAVVDLAALRSAVQRAGGDPASVEPEIPVDLVVD